MLDYQLCALIDGESVDINASKEKFRILEQTLRDKLKELGLDKPSCGVIGTYIECPKPLRRYCPKCQHETPVTLVEQHVDVMLGLDNAFGNVVERHDNVFIEPHADTVVRCGCCACQHVFCDGYIPETVAQFEEMCKKQLEEI